MAKTKFKVKSVNIECPTCGIVEIPLENIYFSGTSQDCEVCGSHGEVTLITKCICGEHIEIELSGW